AMPRAEVAESREKSLGRRYEPHVAGDRLDDERGDLVLMRVAERGDRCEIVVARVEGVGRHRGRYAWTGRNPERRRARSGLHEERDAVPVVAPFELHDPIAPGIRARHTYRAHRGLGTRA